MFPEFRLVLGGSEAPSGAGSCESLSQGKDLRFFLKAKIYYFFSEGNRYLG